MGHIREEIIDDFSGGVTTASRKKDKRFARAIKHFSILGSEDKLIPKRDLIADTFNSNLSTTAALSHLVKFLTYSTAPSTTVQFALGFDTPNHRVFYRDNGAQATGIPNGQWSGDSAGSGTVNTATGDENLFIQYKGIAYAACAGANLVSWTLDIAPNLGGSSVNNTAHALTYTNIFQGLVHSKRNWLFIPYSTSSGSFILSFDGTSWNDTALTFPGVCSGVDICEYGDYIAIVTRPNFLGGKSYLYLWDMDSSLNTTTQKIDLGDTDVQFVENLDGTLITLSIVANNSITFSGQAQVLIKAWNGGAAVTPLMELNCDSTTVTIGLTKQIHKNRLYFMMSAKLNGAWHEGVWSIGKNKYGEYALALEYSINNDTQVTSVTLKGFQILGDYLTVTYTNNGTYVTKVIDDQNYTDTSIVETVISNCGDASVIKDLKGVTVMTEPLPAAGSYTLKYAVDSDTSWTTIFTEGTDNSISFSANSGLPKNYKELRLRLECTGGATPTAISVQQDLLKRNVYEVIWAAIKGLF